MAENDLAQERELGAATVECPTCGKQLKLETTEYKSLVPENCTKCYPPASKKQLAAEQKEFLADNSELGDKSGSEE